MRFHKLAKKAFLLPLFLSAPVFAAVQIIQPSLNAYEEIQEALILAEPGDIIRLTSGTYDLEDSLSLDVDNVQIEGEGMNQTILDFKNQQSGAQGLSVTPALVPPVPSIVNLVTSQLDEVEENLVPVMTRIPVSYA